MDANFHSILIHHSRKCKADIVHTKMGRYSPFAIGTIIHFFCYIAKNILVTYHKGCNDIYIYQRLQWHISQRLQWHISQRLQCKKYSHKFGFRLRYICRVISTQNAVSSWLEFPLSSTTAGAYRKWFTLLIAKLGYFHGFNSDAYEHENKPMHWL